MTIFSAQFQGAAGSATLPFAGLRSGTSTNTPRLLEVKVFTTAANAARIRIVRLTTAGTATAITVNKMFEAQVAAEATPVHTYTSTGPTIQAGEIDIGAVGAAIGSGFHYTYYGEVRLFIPPGATNANGIGLVEVTDTANTYDGTFIWEE
jgi:hypothetical protein